MSHYDAIALRWTLSQETLNECRASAIPDDWTRANIRDLEPGAETAQVLLGDALDGCRLNNPAQHSAEAQRLLRRYSPVIDGGGWMSLGAPEDDPYIKPRHPRMEVKKNGFGTWQPTGKAIKYENAPGAAGAPLFPIHPDNPNYWDEIAADPSIPVGIDEGLKTAIAPTAQGYPTIALRGVTMWSKKDGGVRVLRDEIASLAPGRQFIIGFDQDTNPKTIRNVNRERHALAKALLLAGAAGVKIASWDKEQGKGIDDAIAAVDPAQRSAWLQQVMESAQDSDEWWSDIRKKAAIATLSRPSRYKPNRHTKGLIYMPAIEIKPGVITAISANTGSGKTELLAKLIKVWADAGEFTLVLVPNNSLGQQTARRLGLPHVHDYPHAQNETLWLDARASGGLVCCPDSLLRVLPWVVSAYCRVNLIMDEANQNVDHITSAGTIEDRLPEITEALIQVLGKVRDTQGHLILSEDAIADWAIDEVKKLSGIETVEKYSHRRLGASYKVLSYKTRLDYDVYLHQAMKRSLDAPIFIVTTSQKEAEKLEEIARQICPDANIHRVDSKTNEGGRYTELFENPDQWLKDERPNILILSPTGKSGLSIEGGVSAEDSWFQGGVWGLFTCHDTNTHIQMLNRLRAPVPRFIYCAPSIAKNSTERLGFTPGMILRELEKLGSLTRQIHALEQHDEINMVAQSATLECRAAIAAEQGNMKGVARDWLHERIKGDGHTLTFVPTVATPEGKQARAIASKLKKAALDIVQQRWADERAAADVSDPKYTLEWAIKTSQDANSTQETRIKIEKILMSHRFPGIDFNDPENWLEGSIKNGGRLYRGVELQAWMEDPDAAKILDRRDVDKIMGRSLEALHRLPKRYIKVWLLNKLQLLSVLEFCAGGGVYDNSTPIIQQVKAIALRYASEIYKHLGLTIKLSQTPVEITNKLLRKINHKASSIARLGSRKDRDRQYAIDALTEVHKQFLEAARQSAKALLAKDSSPVSTISYMKENHTRKSWTPPPNTPSEGVGDCPNIVWVSQVARLIQELGIDKVRAAGMVDEAAIAAALFLGGAA